MQRGPELIRFAAELGGGERFALLCFAWRCTALVKRVARGQLTSGVPFSKQMGRSWPLVSHCAGTRCWEAWGDAAWAGTSCALGLTQEELVFLLRCLPLSLPLRSAEFAWSSSIPTALRLCSVACSPRAVSRGHKPQGEAVEASWLPSSPAGRGWVAPRPAVRCARCVLLQEPPLTQLEEPCWLLAAHQL